MMPTCPSSVCQALQALLGPGAGILGCNPLRKKTARVAVVELPRLRDTTEPEMTAVCSKLSETQHLKLAAFFSRRTQQPHTLPYPDPSPTHSSHSCKEHSSELSVQCC